QLGIFFGEHGRALLDTKPLSGPNKTRIRSVSHKLTLRIVRYSQSQPRAHGSGTATVIPGSPARGSIARRRGATARRAEPPQYPDRDQQGKPAPQNPTPGDRRPPPARGTNGRPDRRGGSRA